ncbi:MAG TPA: 2OG-Fe(II) oxygenase [Allosphingosinicella sp.]|nr:2OG-Fe(II) oxygenase [Allosphingosinicella sp.]
MTDRIDWDRVADELETHGCATLPRLLDADRCAYLCEAWEERGRFRSEVIMGRHGYGRGAYRYFDYPLPELVEELRTALYPPIAAIANRWSAALGSGLHYPADHQSFLARCHDSGQTRPTPLLLRYETGDWNALHQDVYGETLFPLQVAILLSEPGEDFTGGEFVLAEQRPRMQSRAEVVPLRRGDAVVFPVRERPVRGSRGWHRRTLRHGVSRLRSGLRFTLGIIFHDAR